MAFKFSLAAVLRIRLSLEEREERILESIARRIAQNLGEQEQLLRDIAEAVRRREVGLQSPGSAAELHLAYQQIKELGIRKEALEQQGRELAELRIDQIRIYEVAHRSRRMLSDLYEKRRELYELEQVRLEQSAIDDSFNARRTLKEGS